MKNDLRSEEKRLEKALRRALWLALAAPAAATAVVSCSGGESSSGASNIELSSSSSGGAMDAGTSGGGGDAADAGEASPCAAYGYVPNPPDNCGDYVRLPCGLPEGVVAADGCFLFLNDCMNICPGPFFNCHTVDESCVDAGIVVDPDGGVSIDCATCPNGVGRAPEGLAPARVDRAASSALGAYFASAAHLEAASVIAFQRLGAELAVHGAPEPLRRAARRAARDEVRHARQMGRMARRFGGAPPPALVEAAPARSLEAIAYENAVEGCVRETFGALVARLQAARAEDGEVARELAIIAKDEARHAALSWAVARWASPRLSERARRRIDAGCRRAVRELRREAAAEAPLEGMNQAGLATAAEKRVLLDALERELWSRANRSGRRAQRLA